ncbi:DUF397 domain-containing protein [Saccharopolyspora sp. 6V]|uniref:DUF397 domain-containing protein n=1 Tax=Saccharopolyspora sp. 6V TaxID=2877239 RepID=UPI001CD5397C|nr:DUF397 domain-containing protein [Saccharopolyspora sp. 6V]MCA1192957.1 DUF397 domain-containing protein [Saccharopolyspora sp. 6V]
MTSSEISGWRTSTRTSATQTCVEVGGAPGIAGVRDTKDRDGGTLRIDSARWAAFLTAIGSGRYDR